ncbi:MAG: thioredoxin family protein [Planctomycetaceae bacterium]
MSKLQTLLTIAAAFFISDFAQAQSCRTGYGQQRTPGYTRDYPANDGYTSYRSPIGYTNGVTSFEDVCRDCGRTYGRTNRDSYYTNYRDTNYRGYGAGRYDSVCRDCNDPRCRCDLSGTGFPQDDFRRGTNYGPRSDELRTPRRDYDGFGRSDDRTRDFRGGDLRGGDFRGGDLRPRRSDYPDLRYPSNGQLGTQYNYTSTRTPNVVQWQSDLRRAADFAKAQQRPMLVTIGADWCTYCKKMKAETFREGRFIQSVNRGRFVSVMLDADKNQSVVSRLGIRSLPTTMIVAPNMQIVERIEGFRTAEQMTAVLLRHSRSAEKQSDMKVAAK